MRDHQHSWQAPGNTLKPVAVIDDWLGPVTAMIRCADCETCGLIYLVGWQAPDLKHRTFALKVVPGAVASTYLKNVSRDYCDLTRKENETHALFAATEPASRLISTTEGVVVERTTPTESEPPHVPWREIAPSEKR